LPATSQSALALQRRWPAINGVWLFGSTLDGMVGLASDSDLATDGLPPLDLLEAMAETESTVGTIPVGLARLESLPRNWQQRIRERAKHLLRPPKEPPS
jgi:predicted nucleotidyltransferase